MKNSFGLTFHHLGLAVRTPEKALLFLSGLGYTNGPKIYDEYQEVNLIFCDHHDMPDVEIIYPVHLNPNIQAPVLQILSKIRNIHLIAPQDYLSFVKLMDASYLVLTDSGGIQEEAPSLGKPVLLMRDTTERPEAVEAGTVKLVGTDKKKIAKMVNQLLTDKLEYQKMSKAHNPYGEGLASQTICKALEEVIL